LDHTSHAHGISAQTIISAALAPPIHHLFRRGASFPCTNEHIQDALSDDDEEARRRPERSPKKKKKKHKDKQKTKSKDKEKEKEKASILKPGRVSPASKATEKVIFEDSKQRGNPSGALTAIKNL
jgi:hypothetical protein